MAVYVYSGVPGSSKTYHVVRQIVKRRNPTITNIGLKDCKNVSCVPLSAINPEMLMAYAERYFSDHRFKEDTIWLVLDECQLLFNSRTWSDASRSSWLAFLSQSRKYGYKVIMIAQSIDMIDKQFRALVEYDCTHRSAGSIFFPFKVLHKLGFPLFCANYRYYDMGTTGTSEHAIISREIYSINRRVYRHYETRQDLTARDFSDVDVTPIVDGFAASAEGGKLHDERSGYSRERGGEFAAEELAPIPSKLGIIERFKILVRQYYLYGRFVGDNLGRGKHGKVRDGQG